jgi:hypothetical protein
VSEQPALEGGTTDRMMVPSGVVEGDVINDPPVGWVETPGPNVMSNLGLRVDQDVAAVLRQGGFFSRHAAWDFNGLVWFRDDRWHEAVWVHRRYVASYTADSPEELMKLVNDQHGWA